MRLRKQILLINKAIVFLCSLGITVCTVQAQQNDCVLLPPAVTIDFGSGNVRDINARLPNYEHDFTTCPLDGYYSYAAHTSNCFNNDWLTFNSDHTNNGGGNMMLVNASEVGGSFFNTAINGLKANTTYQFAAWMVNVCRINGGCVPLPPNITVTLLTTTGKKIAEFITGQLTQSNAPHWKKYFAFFVTPADVSTIILNMEDNTLGGCGNDFAMDDITFCECVKPMPIEQPKKIVIAKPATKPPLTGIKPEQKSPLPRTVAAKKDSLLTTTKKSFVDIPTSSLPTVKEQPVATAIPQPILSRENPVIKQIETSAGLMMIDLYDNGEIDGDTVTIYHNNELIISRAGLSDKPIHFEIKVDPLQPHHELVMVANNLGSIPPNTSLMIITVNGKRYEVHISSSEEKNAKIVIDLRQ